MHEYTIQMTFNSECPVWKVMAENMHEAYIQAAKKTEELERYLGIPSSEILVVGWTAEQTSA